MKELTIEFNECTGIDQCALLLVGSYRNYEPGVSHPLTLMSYKTDVEYHLFPRPCTDITLEGLGREEINSMVSDFFCLPHRITRSLSGILFTKTLGNPMFIKQLIESLVVEKLIYFSVGDKRWMWDELAIGLKPMIASVAKHLADKLQRATDALRTVLKIVACFGSKIDMTTLDLLYGNNANDITSSFDNAAEEGFLVKVGTSYKFSHDSIQEASYDLIAPQHRSRFHKTIAGLLVSNASEARKLEGSAVIFLVVDQIHRVDKEDISNQAEKCFYARLALKAGRSAIDVVNFDSAYIYTKIGLSLLDEGHWGRSYSLSLRLFETVAYTCYIRGQHDDLIQYLNEVFTNAKCFDDRLESYVVLTLSLGLAGEFKNAMSSCMNVLAQLGESFPTHLNPEVMKKSMVETMMALKAYDKEALQKLPLMANKHKQYAMRILKCLLLYSYRAKSPLLSLVACRMVTLTLNHGLAKESARGFVALGNALIRCDVKSVKEGYRIGKLALSLVDMPIASDERGSVFIVFYSYIAPRVEPLQSTFEPLQLSLKEAMLAGDVAFAFIGAVAYCKLRFIGGVELSALDKDIITSVREMARLKQVNTMRLLLNDHYAIVALIGLSKDPLEEFLNGAYFGDKLLQSARNDDDKMLLGQIYSYQLRVASIFGDMERCEMLMNKLVGMRDLATPNFFVEGSVAFTLARKTGDNRWYQRGLECIDISTGWINASKWSWITKVELLNAERHFTDLNFEQAKACYKSAVKSSREDRFVNEEAIAFELLGKLEMEIGETENAIGHFREAHRCYSAWGAHAKANALADAWIH